MKKRFSLSLLTMAIAAVMTTVSARTRQLFDSGWQFTRNGKTIAVNLPHDWDIYEAPDPSSGATVPSRRRRGVYGPHGSHGLGVDGKASPSTSRYTPRLQR